MQKSHNTTKRNITKKGEMGEVEDGQRNNKRMLHDARRRRRDGKQSERSRQKTGKGCLREGRKVRHGRE